MKWWDYRLVEYWGFDLSKCLRKSTVSEEEIEETGERVVCQWARSWASERDSKHGGGRNRFSRGKGRKQDRSKGSLICRWLGKKLKEFLPSGLNFPNGIGKSLAQRKITGKEILGKSKQAELSAKEMKRGIISNTKRNWWAGIKTHMKLVTWLESTHANFFSNAKLSNWMLGLIEVCGSVGQVHWHAKGQKGLGK